MILFVYGKDTFRSHAYLKKMMDKFRVDRDPSGYNCIVLDCLDKTDAAKVPQEIMAVPFLAERRMIVVKNLIASKDAKLKELISEKVEQKIIPDSNILVVYEVEEKYKSKADKVLFELLKAEKYSECFSLLEGRELSGWVNKAISDGGGKIDGAALQFLVANYNGDMWGLNHIVDQLVAYNSSVTTETVKLFVQEKVDDNIFNLVDAIVAGQKQKAFKMIQAQYNSGNDPGYVFAMVLRQFKILIQLKDVVERGMVPQPKAMGLHPFVVKKTLPVLQKYSMESLKKAYEELLIIDIKTKTGQGNQSVMLDIFVGSL